jgi:hypothetical protein
LTEIGFVSVNAGSSLYPEVLCRIVGAPFRPVANNDADLPTAIRARILNLNLWRDWRRLLGGLRPATLIETGVLQMRRRHLVCNNVNSNLRPDTSL